MSDIDNPTYEVYQDDDDGIYTPVPDIDKGDPNTFDRNIGAEVKLSIGTKSWRTGKVRRHKSEPDGSLKGMDNQHSILNTRMYEVKFPDRQIAHHSANVIAENMYSQCDAERGISIYFY